MSVQVAVSNRSNSDRHDDQRGPGASGDDRPNNRSIRWRVVEVGPTNDVDAHYSDEYNLVLDPINIEFKFRLVFKVRTDHFELYIESLIERDVELKLGIRIESNQFRRQVKEVFNILGRNDEGQSQYTSLYWGSPNLFLRDTQRPDVFIGKVHLDWVILLICHKLTFCLIIFENDSLKIF